MGSKKKFQEIKSMAEAFAQIEPLPKSGSTRLPAPLRSPENDNLTKIDKMSVVFDILSQENGQISAKRQGLDERQLKSLAKADVAVDARLDLHGLLREQALAELRRFVSSQHAAGKRILCVIHGKGLHSEHGLPVLKEAVLRALTTPPLAQYVLALSTAHPKHGSTGALIVKLKR